MENSLNPIAQPGLLLLNQTTPVRHERAQLARGLVGTPHLSRRPASARGPSRRLDPL